MKTVKTVEAFSPGHVTGLFYIDDQNPDPLYKGSRGAGFSISKGVHTRITLNESGAAGLVVYIDGKERPDAAVSQRVVELFFEKIGGTLKGELSIDHRSEIPVGSGFGSSGAGALGLSLALNALYGEQISAIEAAQIAHRAEVECKTGLGTVLGETIGGFKICYRAGAPGIGQTEQIPWDEAVTAVFLVFGAFSTRKALKNRIIREKVNNTGLRLLGRLREKPDLAAFSECARRFAEEIELMSARVRSVLNRLDVEEIPASMLMFGEGVFALVEDAAVEKVVSIFDEYRQKASVVVSKIEPRGARVIDAL